MVRGRTTFIISLTFFTLIFLILGIMGISIINLNVNAQSPPVAVALSNQTSAIELSNVTLNGFSSYSPENISISNYNWTETDANAPVNLIVRGSNATFKAPLLAGENHVNYTFSL